jgi:hypothetical protein
MPYTPVRYIQSFFSFSTAYLLSPPHNPLLKNPGILYAFRQRWDYVFKENLEKKNLKYCFGVWAAKKSLVNVPFRAFKKNCGVGPTDSAS